MTIRNLLFTFLLAGVSCGYAPAADKPKITFDEFFNWAEIDSVQMSPDGHSIVMVPNRCDWNQNINREDLWLYRDDARGGGNLIQLTHSGRDHSPRWSPDGQWIAFLSERKLPPAPEDASQDQHDDETTQLFLISAAGGESFPVTKGEEDVHAFAWSADSRTLYFATRLPWTKTQDDAHKKEWKDVVQYRGDERGDRIFRIDVTDAIAAETRDGTDPRAEPGDAGNVTPGSHPLATSPWMVAHMEASPDGRRLAFVTQSVSQRLEKIDEFEIYDVDLANASLNRPARQITHNEAQEQFIHWARDSRHVFFEVQYGSVEGKYKDTQTRVYWVDIDSGEVQRWGRDFEGAIDGYSVAGDGGLLATGRVGPEVQIYYQASVSSAFVRMPGWEGTYELTSVAEHSPRIAFVHSALGRPNEVYLAEGIDKLAAARPVSSFNQLFTERDLPQGKSYQWTADDGTHVEGMLIYPPGKFQAKNLPMFVYIHGGPDDADGNHFEADWYQWDRLAANEGWLVFEPNYRGSHGYGDRFMSQIVPEIVSRPGKDILEGVDALVKDGIADPTLLAVGGYSYGGYLTNWLITQTTRFRAAVTGGGAVENVANWGNDDTTLDDVYFLGGLPWEAQKRYQQEAAIFQMDKVRTPTLILAAANDIRVAAAEAYVLDHALHALNVPSDLLIFPGEDHSLTRNPWHGKIMVREELKWLEKYGGVTPPSAKTGP